LISITDKKDCCGCNACEDICSQNAVSFKTDIEGFWYPEADRESRKYQDYVLTLIFIQDIHLNALILMIKITGLRTLRRLSRLDFETELRRCVEWRQANENLAKTINV
jgi:ferredoxin